MDRGKEFACYEQVETEFGIPMYFADAYAAWSSRLQPSKQDS